MAGQVVWSIGRKMGLKPADIPRDKKEKGSKRNATTLWHALAIILFAPTTPPPS